ncbi:Mucin-associated surface protein (MASP), putative, partial [Trypanosoma cruzi]
MKERRRKREKTKKIKKKKKVRKTQGKKKTSMGWKMKRMNKRMMTTPQRGCRLAVKRKEIQLQVRKEHRIRRTPKALKRLATVTATPRSPTPPPLFYFFFLLLRARLLLRWWPCLH